jgi:hypothetical protein
MVDGWEPSITLELKDDLLLGEEDETELYAQRSKLFRFKRDSWKPCGFGDVKLLQHNSTGQVRFLFRLEQTMQILANHCMCNSYPFCDLRKNAKTENCLVWTAPDCALGYIVVEQFALKFHSDGEAAAFQEKFEFAKAENGRQIKASKLDDQEASKAGAEMSLQVHVTWPPSYGSYVDSSSQAEEKGEAAVTARASLDVSGLEDLFESDDGADGLEPSSAETLQWGTRQDIEMLTSSAASDAASARASQPQLLETQVAATIQAQQSGPQSPSTPEHVQSQPVFTTPARKRGRSPSSDRQTPSPARNGARKSSKIHSAESLSTGMSSEQIQALASIIKLLSQARRENTNAGSAPYKAQIKEACDTADVHLGDCSVSSDRIKAAAFIPHPKCGVWKSNTPLRHQNALKDLIQAFGLVAIFEILHSAKDLDTNRGMVPQYRQRVSSATDLAAAMGTDPTLASQIEAAAFQALPRTGTWMANTPSCHRQALSDLIRVLAVGTIVQKLQKAAAINTNRGSGWYKELVQQTMDVAVASRIDPDLARRIHVAAFTPHPMKGRWMSNTPSWHQKALKDFLTAMSAVTLIDLVHFAVEIDTNRRGGVAQYKELISKACGFADAVELDLLRKIEEAAFKPLPRTGTWMQNTPSCHRRALLDLVHGLARRVIRWILQKAMEIDTNKGSSNYKHLVQWARAVAEASRIAGLPQRIAAAAFQPLPRTGTWKSNTPSCHQKALQDLLLQIQHEETGVLANIVVVVDRSLEPRA